MKNKTSIIWRERLRGELIGFNDRGIVNYWQDQKKAECQNCGQSFKGIEAEKMMFGHIGCPKPNGAYIPNDLTPDGLEQLIAQETVRLRKLLDEQRQRLAELKEKI